MTRRQRRSGTGFQFTQPTNWTMVAVVSFAVLIAATVGPLAWRFAAQATDTEMKFGLTWMMVLVTLLLLFGGFTAMMKAFSQMTLRHVQQDDADEAHKSQQQFSQLAGLMVAMNQAQGSGQPFDLAQIAKQMSGGNGGFRDATGKDVELGRE